MKRASVGSYEEARLCALRRFSRLTPTQKMQWLSGMQAFIKEGRASLPVPRPRKLRRP